MKINSTLLSKFFFSSSCQFSHPVRVQSSMNDSQILHCHHISLSSTPETDVELSALTDALNWTRIRASFFFPSYGLRRERVRDAENGELASHTKNEAMLEFYLFSGEKTFSSVSYRECFYRSRIFTAVRARRPTTEEATTTQDDAKWNISLSPLLLSLEATFAARKNKNFYILNFHFVDERHKTE